MAGYVVIRHKVRPDGVFCDDRTEWVVVEQSPSFYICYAEGEGFGLKRKKDYEIVAQLVEREVTA